MSAPPPTILGEPAVPVALSTECLEAIGLRLMGAQRLLTTAAALPPAERALAQDTVARIVTNLAHALRGGHSPEDC